MVLIETLKKILNYFAPWELFSLQFHLIVEKTIIQITFLLVTQSNILFDYTYFLFLFSNADLIDLTFHEF